MSFFDDPPLRDFPDHALRHLLEDPANLRDLAAAVRPDLVERMDFTHVEYEPREFLMEDWRKRECDLFVRVPFRADSGQGHVLVCILVEHQSSPDPRMPLRTLVYSANYWEREWKAWEQQHAYNQALVLTPILPIVFYSGSMPWNAGIQLVEMFPDVPELRTFVPRWSPLLWNLSEQDPAALLSSASAWLQALAVVRVEDADSADFETAFRQVCERLDTRLGQEKMRTLDLLWFVLSWVKRRRPRVEQEPLRRILSESVKDEGTKREVEKMPHRLGETLEDYIGAQAEIRNARRNLRTVLEGRFGTIPEALLERINACQDANQLDAWIGQAARVKALDDLVLE